MPNKSRPWGSGEDIDFEKSKNPYKHGSGRPVSEEQALSPLEILEFLNSFMPVTGDIQSGVEAVKSFKNKDYLGTALGALGTLPLVPNTTKYIKGIPYAGMSSIDEFLKNKNIPFMTVDIPKQIILDTPDVNRVYEVARKVDDVYGGGGYPRAMFHAGDAGIGGDTVARNMGGGRGTGHFGTGTYAVSDYGNLPPFYTENRPVIGLISRPEDKFFSGDSEELQKAHSALRELNYLGGNEKLIPKDKILEAMENFDKYWELKQTNPDLAEVADILKKQRLYLPSKKIFTETPESALDAVNEHIKARMGLGGSFWKDRVGRDSASTRYMKKQGYSGVTTGLAPEMDNTAYGSVIYRKGKF